MRGWLLVQYSRSSNLPTIGSQPWSYRLRTSGFHPFFSLLAHLPSPYLPFLLVNPLHSIHSSFLFSPTHFAFLILFLPPSSSFISLTCSFSLNLPRLSTQHFPLSLHSLRSTFLCLSVSPHTALSDFRLSLFTCFALCYPTNTIFVFLSFVYGFNDDGL